MLISQTHLLRTGRSQGGRESSQTQGGQQEKHNRRNYGPKMESLLEGLNRLVVNVEMKITFYPLASSIYRSTFVIIQADQCKKNG